MKRRVSEPAVDDTGRSVPERSLTQRLDALELANEVRTKRAKLKRDLKDGRVSLLDVVLDPPDYLDGAKLFDMLLAVPKFGRAKTNKVLTKCRIPPSRTVGALTQRQRDALIDRLGGYPSESDDEELTRSLAQLLEEARHVGRLAGRGAGDAGCALHASAPRPDAFELRAALTRLAKVEAGTERLTATATGGPEGPKEPELDLTVGPSPDTLERPLAEEDEIAVSASELAAENLRRENVRRAVAALPQREREVIEMRFGLTGGRPRTLEEVGRAFNVTRERIRQIENHVLKKLESIQDAPDQA